MAAIRAEKVERLSRIDWASPTVAWKKGNTGSRVPSAAGIGIPAWCMTHRRPTVLRATDLPPALGPLMTRVRVPVLAMEPGRGARRSALPPRPRPRSGASPAPCRGGGGAPPRSPSGPCRPAGAGCPSRPCRGARRPGPRPGAPVRRRRLEVLRAGRDDARGLQQDALDLLPLLRVQGREPVVQVHHLQGLDEGRGARGGGVVEDALHIGPPARLDREDQAAVPHGVGGLAQDPCPESARQGSPSSPGPVPGPAPAPSGCPGGGRWPYRPPRPGRPGGAPSGAEDVQGGDPGEARGEGPFGRGGVSRARPARLGRTRRFPRSWRKISSGNESPEGRPVGVRA